METRMIIAAMVSAAVCFAGCGNAPADGENGYSQALSEQAGVSKEGEISEAFDDNDINDTAYTEYTAAKVIRIAGEDHDINAEELSFNGIAMTVEDIAKLSEFGNLKRLTVDVEAMGSGAGDLSGLSALGCLESLCINGNCPDLGFLSEMTSLKALSLYHFECEELINVPSGTGIASLDIDESMISDISGIENLSSLKSLTLNHFSCEDYSPVGKLSALESYSVDFSLIKSEDLSYIGNLSSLKQLRLNPYPSAVTFDTDALADCTELEAVELSGYFSGLDFCSGLKNLKEFTFIASDFEEYDITPLMDSRQLEKLTLICNCDEEALSEIRSVLNTCEITVRENERVDFY